VPLLPVVRSLRGSAVGRGLGRGTLAARRGGGYGLVRDSAISGARGMAGDAPGGRSMHSGPASGWPVRGSPAAASVHGSGTAGGWSVCGGPAAAIRHSGGPAGGWSVCGGPAAASVHGSGTAGGRPMHSGPAGGRPVRGGPAAASVHGSATAGRWTVCGGPAAASVHGSGTAGGWSVCGGPAAAIRHSGGPAGRRSVRGGPAAAGRSAGAWNCVRGRARNVVRDSAISGARGMAGDAPGGRPMHSGPATRRGVGAWNCVRGGARPRLPIISAAAGRWTVHSGPAGGWTVCGGPAAASVHVSGTAGRWSVHGCPAGGWTVCGGPAGGRSMRGRPVLYPAASGWPSDWPGSSLGGRFRNRLGVRFSMLLRSDCVACTAQPHKHGKNRCCGASENVPAEKLRSHRVLFSYSISWFRAAPPVRESGCAKFYLT
jgi:hypothetical protein